MSASGPSGPLVPLAKVLATTNSEPGLAQKYRYMGESFQDYS